MHMHALTRPVFRRRMSRGRTRTSPCSVGCDISQQNRIGAERRPAPMTPRCGLLLAGLTVSTAALTQPYVNGKYDSSTSAEYWRARPFAVAARASELVQKSAGFGALLLSDLAANKLEERGSQRAADLVELLTRLGPTFSARSPADACPLSSVEALPLPRAARTRPALSDRRLQTSCCASVHERSQGRAIGQHSDRPAAPRLH